MISKTEKKGTWLKEKDGGGVGTKTPLGSLSSFDFGFRVLFLTPGFVKRHLAGVGQRWVYNCEYVKRRVYSSIIIC